MKKILVPIDFSNCSKNALIYAKQLANEIGTNLMIINVLYFDTSQMENPISATVMVEEQISLARRRLTKFVQEAIESISSTSDETQSIEMKIEVGRVETAICDEADKNKVDYIIMGTQGENSTLDKYLGSVASNVLKNASCPVMVIPENSKFEKNAAIGYATNFLDADPFEIWKTMKLFQPFQSKMKCVHFSEKNEFDQDRISELASYFSETAPEFKIEFYNRPSKDKVKDMNAFIEEQNIGILVMYRPKRTFFESIFHKSYTQSMAQQIKIPLLVFKENK